MSKPILFISLASLASLGLAVCCSCGKRAAVHDDGHQQEMDAAIERARLEIDTFVAALESGAGEEFGVKAPIEHGGQTEHLWLTGVTYREGVFEGMIGNRPALVENVTLGQTWRVRRDEISDWMFVRDGKLHGSYTMRPLLKSMPPEEAERFRSRLAAP